MTGSSSTSGDERARLVECLEELSRRQGIWREDLKDLLQGRLSSLRGRWGINLDDGIDAARTIIASTLNGHIKSLYPRRGNQPLTDRKEVDRYRFILVVSFNTADDRPQLRELRQMNLQDRRAWLAKRHDGRIKASTRTSQRILKEAIEHIAERLANGVETPVEVSTEEVISSPTELAAPPPPSKHRRPVLIASFVVFVVAMVTGLFVFNPFRPSSGPEPITIQNSPIDFTAEQFTGPDLVVPEALSQLERPPVTSQNQALRKWGAKHHAVHANRMAISFFVRSGQVAPAEILAARVNVERREAPMGGTWIAPSGAGPQPVRQLYVDLDATPPKITKGGGWDFPLRVSQSDPEAFSVTARTKTCHCYWTIELVVQLPDGQSRVLKVDDHSTPFELTSSTNTSAKTLLPSSDSDPWPSSSS